MRLQKDLSDAVQSSNRPLEWTESGRVGRMEGMLCTDLSVRKFYVRIHQRLTRELADFEVEGFFRDRFAMRDGGLRDRIW